jgi:tetratricopeptide (TPR) repeat protein
MRTALALAVSLLATLPVRAAVPEAARAWAGEIELPTYEEGLPDVNPPFDVFQTRRFNYPYTLRESLTNRRSPQRWRTLNLENEFLKVVVLPDLGGHLYSCVDKATGQDMFYAQTAIKKAKVAYRGAWTALGIEFNFPVSHNWVTVSPVDFALGQEQDGSATLTVGNVDRVYGMQWRVTLRLRPGRAVLEQDVALYNRSDVRHRFYWWNNAGVRVFDDSLIQYPMRFTASHGFRNIDTWPVNQAGVDLSVVGHHLYGPVSEFSHGSREGFMGVYHPKTGAGVVHYASPLDAPTKKIWSWSADADGLDWRKALSDDGSAYVEVQAGLFRNQETYAFLEPQETIRFREYWLPVRGIGGITRANAEAVAELTRRAAGAGRIDLLFGLNLTEGVAAGSIVLKDGDAVLRTVPLTLSPSGVVERTFAALPADAKYTVEVRNAAGRTLLVHTEDSFDMTPASEIQLGPQKGFEFPSPGERSDGDLAAIGADQELNGKRLDAWQTYRTGLGRFPDSFALLKAAGRVAVDLGRFAEAADWLERARGHAPTDAEVAYYLGLARASLGETRVARTLLEAAQAFRDWKAPALLALARLESREANPGRALALIGQAVAAAPDAVLPGAIQVALLRHAGRADEARRRVAVLRKLDPTSSLLRYEAVQLGGVDTTLFHHLGADPERVLDLTVQYMGLGFHDDALALLDRDYPKVGGLEIEPGARAPQEHPEIVYYRGYCRERQGGSGGPDFAAASKLDTRYVFPSRPQSVAVFTQALAENPADATAHFLLGSLRLASGDADAAIAEWQRARELDPRLPVLHRNLGRTLFHIKNDPAAALAVFLEGMDSDPANADLYQGADQCLSLLGRPAGERVAALERYPDRAGMPADLLQRLALGLAEVGRAVEGREALAGRFFPREEWGTNVRQVFLEIRLYEALSLARQGRKQELAEALQALGREEAGYSFTRDGMTPFIDAPRVQFEAGELMALAGDEKAASVHWKKATEGHETFFRGVAFSYLAARRLGGPIEAEWQTRLEPALAEAQQLLERGTSFPGVVVYAQGMLLRALGREAEAKEHFRRALTLPDQLLSHFLSRRALGAAGTFQEPS